MKNVRFGLALAGLFVVPLLTHAQYADAVVSYNSGTGYAAGYTTASAALGAPASGASVTPFAPPYSKSQIVSIGAGGEITLQLSTPIVNDPADPYGINFILFANEFFVEGSGGVVSGLYNHTAASAITVLVSSDDSTWYTLNPSLAPQAGSLYPTSGNGNPQIAVNPSLTLASFTGQNLAGITSLYNGSAGGTGYDLAWALDGNGNSVDLASADYVQIDVERGVLDLDAVSVVPEPATGVLLVLGGLVAVCYRRKVAVQKMAVTASLAVAILLIGGTAQAISLEDVQVWTGSGTNRAALVIEWSVPQSFANATVPVADKTLVWGYRFSGTATGTEMLNAVITADPKLYVVEDNSYGTFVTGIGYNLNANGLIGITDGTSTNYITNGILTTATVDIDSAQAVNGGDLYWGGLYGPNWELWNETNDAGGFWSSPNRGTNSYWTPTDTVYFAAGYHGQWAFAQAGLDDLPLTNGSWIGFSVAAGEYESVTNAPYNLHKHAPPSPDGTYVAYVGNTNDFAMQITSTNNIDAAAPYNNPAAVLGRPTLQFLDPYDGGVTDRVSIIDDPYNVTPAGSDVITEIKSGGQITVQLGRRVYDDPNNPYGLDLIIYGNSFFVASGFSGGSISDGTDLNTAVIGDGMAGIYGHPTTVSVSQDGTNWYTYGTTSVLIPDNAYRWDDTNASWTDEQTNPTKPLNPAINLPDRGTVAGALDQFIGSAGGTAYDLKQSGLPWIQYVQIQPGAGTYTVIDAIAAVKPVVVGDALSITPDNLAAGITNLYFQNPTDPSENLISLSFDSVSTNARISTVALSEFSAYAPVIGNVSSAYKIALKPISGAGPVNYLADVGLRTGASYTGSGGDLRVYQWSGTNWSSQPFTFNPSNDEVLVTGVTDFSTVVVSQIIPPQLAVHSNTNGFAIQYTPVVNCAHILERSTDFVTWTPICTNTPGSTQPVTVQEPNATAGMAFYRVLLNP